MFFKKSNKEDTFEQSKQKVCQVLKNWQNLLVSFNDSSTITKRQLIDELVQELSTGNLDGMASALRIGRFSKEIGTLRYDKLINISDEEQQLLYAISDINWKDSTPKLIKLF